MRWNVIAVIESLREKTSGGKLVRIDRKIAKKDAQRPCAAERAALATERFGVTRAARAKLRALRSRTRARARVELRDSRGAHHRVSHRLRCVRHGAAMAPVRRTLDPGALQPSDRCKLTLRHPPRQPSEHRDRAHREASRNRDQAPGRESCPRPTRREDRDVARGGNDDDPVDSLDLGNAIGIPRDHLGRARQATFGERVPHGDALRHQCESLHRLLAEQCSRRTGWTPAHRGTPSRASLEQTDEEVSVASKRPSPHSASTACASWTA